MTAPSLTEFLLARIAEDEVAALATCGMDWRTFNGYKGWTAVRAEARLSSTFIAEIQNVHDAAHIARHDPARVLAEVEAKRRIVESVERSPWPQGTNGLGPSVLRHLTLPYADHPDYRPEWAP